eukprot:4684204-Prymnesium_polylepis.1
MPPTRICMPEGPPFRGEPFGHAPHQGLLTTASNLTKTFRGVSRHKGAHPILYVTSVHVWLYAKV